MKLNATETSLLGAIILGWASLPLALHFSGSPTWADRTGPVMVGGLCVAGAAAFAVLWRAARRLADTSDRMMEQAGFETLVVRDAESEVWLPPQFTGRLGRIDDFAVAGEPVTARPLRRRPNPAGFTYVYQITLPPRGNSDAGRRREGYTVTCLETPSRRWPEFTVLRRTWARRIECFGRKDTVDLGTNTSFSRHWIIRSRTPDAVRALFTPEFQATIQMPPDFRVAGLGTRLFIYAPGARLLPETVGDWTSQSEALALRIAQGNQV